MSNWEAVVTDAGQLLLASWITGTTFKFDSVKAGSGTVETVALHSQTALVSQKQTVSLLGAEPVTDGVKLKIQITPPTIGYMLSQIGVFGSVDDGESVLVALFQNPDGLTIPSISQAPDFIYRFYGTVVMSNSGAYTIDIDTSACATDSDLQAHMSTVAGSTAFGHVKIQTDNFLKNNNGIISLDNMTAEGIGAVQAPSGTVPGRVTDLEVWPAPYSEVDTSAILFKDPDDENWAGTILVRKAVPAWMAAGYGCYPQDPSDGVVLLNNKTRNYYNTLAHACYDVGQSSLYTYFYRFFTYNSSGKFNTSEEGNMEFTITPRSTFKLWEGTCAVGSSLSPNIDITGGRLFYGVFAVDGSILRGRAIGTYSKRGSSDYITLTAGEIVDNGDYSLRATLSSSDGGSTWTLAGAKRTLHGASGHTFTTPTLVELGRLL